MSAHEQPAGHVPDLFFAAFAAVFLFQFRSA